MSAFGQCVFAHGEPNAFPVPVLYKFCAAATYFQDTGFEENCIKILEFIKRIPKDKPIIPFPRIGLGHSRLKEFAPKTYMFLHKQLDRIKYPNIVINYKAEII